MIARNFNAALKKTEEIDLKKKSMYPFAERVLKIYLRAWSRQGKSELHENRMELLKRAVNVVQKHQVRPEGSGPFSGNSEVAVKVLLPILEDTLVMPKRSGPYGSKVRAYLCMF